MKKLQFLRFLLASFVAMAALRGQMPVLASHGISPVSIPQWNQIRETVPRSLTDTPQILSQLGRDRPDFFKEGQEQLEQEIQKIQQQRQGSPILGVDTQQWQMVSLQDSGFSVLMPPGDLNEDNDRVEIANGTLNFQIVTSHGTGCEFLAASTQDLNDALWQNPAALFSHLKDAIVSTKNGSLVGDQAISFQGYSGQEFQFQIEREFVTFRMYLVGKRLYLMGFKETDASSLSNQGMAFFNSLQIQP